MRKGVHKLVVVCLEGWSCVGVAVRDRVWADSLLLLLLLLHGDGEDTERANRNGDGQDARKEEGRWTRAARVRVRG